jgi:16S rRNA pseudouridine516 synthase
MRVDKYLADMGAGTRSEIKKSIRKDGARIGDALIHDPGFLIPETEPYPEVLYQGQRWQYEPIVWYMMNKPAGVLSASEDRRQRTVLDLITERKRTDLFPVGRLDKDTEGLLLITNDGETAHRLLSPKFHVDKTYLVRLAETTGEKQEFAIEDAERFAEGISYDVNLTALPAKLEPAPYGLPGEALVTIREGKFHQIKKMVAALGGGKEVGYLKRLRFGPLQLDERLSKGEYRRLSEEECRLLYRAAGRQDI